MIRLFLARNRGSVLTTFLVSRPSEPGVSAQDLTEDEEAEAVDEDVVDDVTAEDEDDEAEVEDDENAELVSEYIQYISHKQYRL